MKKDVYLFYYTQHDPLTFFNIRNSHLRNQSITIDYRAYNNITVWESFVKSFITSSAKILFDNNIVMNSDFKGFILMYFDTIMEKTILITDPDTIVQKISE